MCGRITTIEWGELIEVIGSLGYRVPEEAANIMPDWPATGGDAFPRRLVPVAASKRNPCPVEHGGEHEDEHEGETLVLPEMLSWGYTIEGERDVVFNTRLETISSVPLWRESFKNNHCIVPVRAFYEPHGSEAAVNPKTGRKVKQLYRFTDERNSLGRDLPGVFLLAGIWRDDGVFSIITTKADPPVKPVHPRMPVVLDADSAHGWLSFEEGSLIPDNKGLECEPVYPEREEPTQETLF